MIVAPYKLAPCIGFVSQICVVIALLIVVVVRAAAGRKGAEVMLLILAVGGLAYIYATLDVVGRMLLLPLRIDLNGEGPWN